MGVKGRGGGGNNQNARPPSYGLAVWPRRDRAFRQRHVVVAPGGDDGRPSRYSRHRSGVTPQGRLLNVGQRWADFHQVRLQRTVKLWKALRRAQHVLPSVATHTPSDGTSTKRSRRHTHARTAINVPRPGPNSTNSTWSGCPICCHMATHHTPSSSPNSWLISGDVVKSPRCPNTSRVM